MLTTATSGTEGLEGPRLLRSAQGQENWGDPGDRVLTAAMSGTEGTRGTGCWPRHEQDQGVVPQVSRGRGSGMGDWPSPPHAPLESQAEGTPLASTSIIAQSARAEQGPWSGGHRRPAVWGRDTPAGLALEPQPTPSPCPSRAQAHLAEVCPGAGELPQRQHTAPSLGHLWAWIHSALSWGFARALTPAPSPPASQPTEPSLPTRGPTLSPHVLSS